MQSLFEKVPFTHHVHLRFEGILRAKYLKSPRFTHVAPRGKAARGAQAGTVWLTFICRQCVVAVSTVGWWCVLIDGGGSYLIVAIVNMLYACVCVMVNDDPFKCMVSMGSI